MAVAVTVNCYIDWDNNESFADSNEDVSAYLQNASVSRGRSSVNDEFAPGAMTVELDNQTGLFSPFNASGSLYGSILPGRAIKLEAVHSTVTYPVFYGYVSSYSQSRTPDGRPSVVIQALDAFDILRFGKIRTALFEDKLPSQLITSILDAAGWSASLRDLDTGTSTVPFFWAEQIDPLTALRQAAKQELGGSLYMSADGKVTFKNRFYRGGLVSSATLTGPQALGFEARRDDVIDKVQFQRGGLSLDTDLTTVFSQSPVGQAVSPGTASKNNQMSGSFSLAAKNVQTPSNSTDDTYSSSVEGTSPVAYWRLGESSGTTAADEEGSHDGTYVGSPTLGATGALYGAANTGVEFDGSTQYVDVPYSAALNPTTMTIEAWFRMATATAAVRVIMSSFYYVTILDFGGWRLEIGSDERLRFLIFNSAGTSQLLQGPTISADELVHVVVTYDDRNIAQMFVNGSRVVATAVGAIRTNTSGDFIIGAFYSLGSPAFFFPGLIDEVSVYDKILSDESIKDHYYAGLYPDYSFNSAANLTGTDKTAQVDVDDFSAYGGGFAIDFDGLDSSDVYLSRLNVRGQAIRRSNDNRLITVTPASSIVSGQVLSDSFDFYDDVDEITGFANLKASTLSTIQPRPSVSVIPGTDAQMAEVLGFDLGDRITITNTTGPYPTEINDDFHIESINISFAPGVLVTCQLGLFTRDQALGSLFRISSDDSSAEYSLIATDAATSGYDRIGV